MELDEHDNEAPEVMRFSFEITNNYSLNLIYIMIPLTASVKVRPHKFLEMRKSSVKFSYIQA